MSDVGLTSATKTLSGEQFDVEAVVTCNSKGGTSYSFTTFDKDGNPAALRSQFWMGVITVSVDLRREDEEPIGYFQRNPAFNNKIKFPANGGSADLAEGRSPVIRHRSSIRTPMPMPSRLATSVGRRSWFAAALCATACSTSSTAGGLGRAVGWFQL
jgi:hypothetical protein